MSIEARPNLSLATREDWALDKFKQNLADGALWDENKTVLRPMILDNPTGATTHQEVDAAGDELQGKEADQILPATTTSEILAAHETITGLLDGIINQVKTGVHQGVGEGYLPERVLPELDTELAITAVRVVDAKILDVIYGSDPRVQGDYNMGTDVISAAHDLKPEEVESTVLHEYLHKLSGGTFRFKEDEGIVRTRTGFAERRDRRPEIEVVEVRHGCLNEAVNSHIERAIIDGDFATIDPNERSEGDDDDFHYAYRALLATFIDRSGGLIDLKTITRAAFEDNGEQPVTTDRRAMVRQSRSAYGPGAYSKLEKLFIATDALYHHDHASASQFLALFERIKGPKIGPYGEVQEAGSIDTTGL